MDWQYWVIGGAAFVALPYVLGPLVVLAVQRFSTEYELSVLAPDDASVPEQAIAHWNQTDPAMARLGFEAGPRARLSGVVPNVAVYLAFYRHRAHRDLAVAPAAYQQTGGGRKHVVSYVEFGSDMLDGSSVTTGNSTRAGFDPNTPDRVTLRFPAARSPEALYRLHRAGAQRFGRAARRPIPEGAWWEITMRESLETYGARMASAGLMRPSGKRAYRLTIKGAFVGTWINLHPFLWVRNRRLGRLERELSMFAGV